MHYQIFIPDDIAPRGSTPTVALPIVGLADHVANCDSLPAPDGPDGRGGTVYAWRNRKGGAAGMQMGYRPSEQTAHEAIAWDGLDAGRYFVLLWKDAPPKPHELERRYPLFGESFEFGDGETWRVPNPLDLPADLRHNRSGQPLYELQPEFHPFARLADDILDRCQREAFGDIRDGEVAALLLDALRINYRLTIEVADNLPNRLFTTSTIAAPMLHACGLQRARELAQTGGA